MLEYRIKARRIDSHGSLAECKAAEIALDTDVKGSAVAFNPAELFLAAIAACMIKGAERALPLLDFRLRGMEVALHGVRQDSPPMMKSIDYEIVVDTDEDDRRLELLHTNIRKYGTISNTVAAAVELNGRVQACLKGSDRPLLDAPGEFLGGLHPLGIPVGQVGERPRTDNVQSLSHIASVSGSFQSD